MTPASSIYFQQNAKTWDEISAGYFGTEVLEAAIAKAYLRPEMIVADIGAGTGFVAAGLASLVNQVHLIDGTAEMLEVAKKNLSRFQNIMYHEADGGSLPFPNASLDAVFANMYLHHTVDPLAAIQEMVRVLRPGGRLVITDLEAHRYTWLKDEMADVWQGFDLDQLRTWYQQAGLVNIIVDGTGQYCCAESSNATRTNIQGREAKINVFIATGTRRMVRRDAVQENYAAIAESGTSCGCTPATTNDQTGCCGSGGSSGSSCCSGSGSSDLLLDVSFQADYTPVELEIAPREASDFSLGCGNPFAMAKVKPGDVVLDIGSGGGLDSFLAASRVGPEGRVIGVDMTPAMLERARASALRNQITNVEFRQGYAEQLPIADETVDVILSNCVINLAEDKGQVFREAFRVLKPGGRLEVSDMVTSGALPREAQQDGAGWAQCITGALPETEYLELIAQAGFEGVTSRRSSSAGKAEELSVYSVIASAQKPAATMVSTACCGGSSCCESQHQ